MDVFALGYIPYIESWRLQERLVRARLDGQVGDTLLLLEHPPTITLGRAADMRHLLASPDVLDRLGVTVVETDRGGDVTFHGPGQIVGYPIVDLRLRRTDVHWYLRQLEGAILDVCCALGLAACRFPPHTGVWIADRKIAAIGIKLRRWVTSHGFALNVADLRQWFRLIVPCGLAGYDVTSLEQELGYVPDRDELHRALAERIVRRLASSGESVRSEGNESPTKIRRIAGGSLDTVLAAVLECKAVRREQTTVLPG